MTNCIICHTEISEVKDTLRECVNQHPVHEDCLGEWVAHSIKCPLCNEEYPKELITKLSNIKESEEHKALDEEKKKEREAKIKKIADDMVYLKNIEKVDELIEKKEFDEAIDFLFEYDNDKMPKKRRNQLLFLKGKACFLKGRFDLAINHLFKLVKIDFDYPDGFLYLAKAYQELGLEEKAKWAFDRVKK